MSTSLNQYRNYIDQNTKEGIALFDSALYDFHNPLGDERLSASPKHAMKLVSTINRLANQFGYDWLLQNVATTRTVTPGANAGDPDTVVFGGYINILE